jgi:hypothetical protein
MRIDRALPGETVHTIEYHFPSQLDVASFPVVGVKSCQDSLQNDFLGFMPLTGSYSRMYLIIN